MVADDVATAQRREADRSVPALAVAVVRGDVLERLFLRCGDDLAHLQRGAARRIDLHAVVRLDDLDVESFGERAAGDVEQLQHDVDADAHVGREDDRDVLGVRRDRALLRRIESGRADHRCDAGFGARRHMRESTGRSGEIDQHVSAGQGRRDIR